jgi:hypothetical protein
MESSLVVLDECIARFFTIDDQGVENACLFFTFGNRKAFTCLLCACSNVPVVARIWPSHSGFTHVRDSTRLRFSHCSLGYHASEARHVQKRGEFLLDLQYMKTVLHRYVRLFTLPHSAEIANSNQISDPLWRDFVQAALFRYLVAPMCDTLDMEGALGERDLLKQALERVQSRQFWNHSSLLACAVWKAQCMLKMPVGGGGLFAHQQYEISGWKRSKPQQLKSAAISTIVSSVRPFLDPHTGIGSHARYTPKQSSGGTMHLNSTEEALLKYLDDTSSWLPLSFSVTVVGREYQYHDKKECRLCNRSDMDDNAQRFHFFDEQHREHEQTLQSVSKRCRAIGKASKQ